ncbi:hypothetical protein HBI67_211460 [Parastagonospora nodorum]|nr:hypothetical protein HBH76_205980 [Parastagonospora nodorum]KAH5533231.1 hypothetical protein HBI27_204860 [Parastagonospora nodorum]KAH6051197.1 hypothetical protein HBI67_211460 [Parastagonospora nodorum]KAH6059279.1 hypothetical protein HBI66_203900 [Parastagonospora nodorum]KAH6387252.1 hypothetical protein HBI14_209540 [Parastagonospora nodorum]
MSSIEAALAAIELLEPGEKIVYTQIAARYGVDRRTLARRHQGATISRDAQAQNQQALHPQQEKELLRYIKRLTRQGLPPTRPMIRRFNKRHKNRHMEVRLHSNSGLKYKLYFNLLIDKISQYNVEPRHIYNMDEKGFMLGILTRSKRVFSRRLYEEGKIKAHIQDGSREWVTLLACICADGSYLEPALLYQSASGSIQDSWLQAFDPDDHRARFASSLSGWTNNDIGLAWLKQVFDRSTKAKARSSYRLLILDGHGSHLSMDFIEYCDQNRILLMVYPPHSTHTLQPLDVVMFKPLSSAYSAQVASFMERSQGLTSMSKRDFYPMFIAACEASFKKDTILKAFEATGLSPLNPEAILKRFNQPAQSGQSSDSDSSALSASDWRKIRQLVNRVVDDRDQRKISKLNQTIHQLSIRSVLAEQENIRLKEALINEKKRRKRGKALPLEAEEEYHGGAVFWSPSKVKEAHDRRLQQRLEEEQQQLQKAEIARDRERQRQAKAQAIELRRKARAEARIVRQAEKAREAADRASRAAARRAQQRLQQAEKIARKGKRHSLKASIKAASKKRVSAQAQGGGEASGAAAGPPPSQSRHGRAIKLPAKYR